MGRTDDAKRAAAKAQIKILESTLQLYTLDIGLFPSNEQGLKALVEKPTSNPQPANWKAGGYHGKLPSIHGGTTMAIISARLFLLLKPA
jgi:general secretion pathway protein G